MINKLNSFIGNYLINDIYNVDSVFLKNKEWAHLLYDVKIVRRHFQLFRTGENDYIEDDITEEDYLKNYNDGSYQTEINYGEIISSIDSDKFEHEFFYTLSSSIIEKEKDIYKNITENLFGNFDGETSKRYLRSTFNSLLSNREELEEILDAKNQQTNSFQKAIIKAYSQSYIDLTKSLLLFYKTVCPELIFEYEELINLKSTIKQPPKWLHFAIMLAEGRIEIQSEKGSSPSFYLDGLNFKNIQKLSEKIASELKINEKGIRTYVSETLNESKSRDKNIFIKSRIPILEAIKLSVIARKKTPSDYFLRRLESLQEAQI